MKIKQNITQLVGNTPHIKLNSFSPNIIAKLEKNNPMSSVKDRIALSMIEKAEKEGKIDKKTTIIEPTSGNTGIGLAFICASKNLNLTITMPESMSKERRKLMKIFGAKLILTPKEKGMKGAIKKAQEINEQKPNTFMPQQFKNKANPKIHKQTTGPEIWNATNGEIDAFIAGVGTGGTLTGVSEYIKEVKGKKDFQTIAVEPKNSAILSGEKPGSHGIQGIGAGFIPEILRTELIDQVIPVGEKEAKKTTKKLAKQEGILAGISSGAALKAATKYIKKPENKDKLTVVMLPDTGERYLSTDLFRNL
ncbi:Cysteine synthase CysK [Methanonatronarchaeum thermophilum]|uniref:Cysteine synthase CysK n=1 Tax=Methanonatronarchaeum thermophilum TaxID=1927129 RepID=A0A1Y3GB99_9EURY|nr:cysteine synthase A [Methanonatronarchaeum thermophilum]OUJ18520.1 Cysteine synthase CysK [Methanonatronarchaeum thermophilum]